MRQRTQRRSRRSERRRHRCRRFRKPPIRWESPTMTMDEGRDSGRQPPRKCKGAPLIRSRGRGGKAVDLRGPPINWGWTDVTLKNAAPHERRGSVKTVRIRARSNMSDGRKGANDRWDVNASRRQIDPGSTRRWIPPPTARMRLVRKKKARTGRGCCANRRQSVYGRLDACRGLSKE